MSSNDRHAGIIFIAFCKLSMSGQIFLNRRGRHQVCPDDDDININADIMEQSIGIPVGQNPCVSPQRAPCCPMVQNNDNQ